MRIWTLVLVGGSLAFATACQPGGGDAENPSVVITDDVAASTEVQSMETAPAELVTAAYTGRLEFFDANGTPVSPEAPFSLTILDQLRFLNFDANRIDEILTDVSDVMDMSDVVEIRGYSDIVGLPDGVTDPRLGEVLHSGLVFVKRGDALFGVNHELNWNDETENFMISVTPSGFSPTGIDLMMRGNVREDVLSGDLIMLPGEWVGDDYVMPNGRDGDTRFHYTLIRLTDPETGETLDFYGPDNFQTYR